MTRARGSHFFRSADVTFYEIRRWRDREEEAEAEGRFCYIKRGACGAFQANYKATLTLHAGNKLSTYLPPFKRICCSMYLQISFSSLTKSGGIYAQLA